jgi:PST family polysaccharide transporter
MLTAPVTPSPDPAIRPQPGGRVSDSPPGRIRLRALRAMGWTLSGQAGEQVVRLAVVITLSRLLVPSDFGLVAMVATITGFATVLTQAGVSNALIQRQVLDRRHVASAAWLTLVLGVVLAAVTVAISPVIALFFHRHALQALTIGFAVDFLVSAPGLVPSAMLSRELRFAAVVTAELAGVTVAGAAAVTQAALHPSPWPMVTFLVVSDLVTSIVLTVAAPYPVALTPDRQALRELWAFGGGLLGYTVFNYWSRNADNLLIGKVIGSVALGIYSRCYLILLFPVQQVAQVVNRVMFPAMSAVQDDHPRVRSAYLRTISVVAVVVFPATAVLLVAAHPLVIGVLGNKWRAAVPVIRVFAGIAAIQSIGTTTGWLYQVTGHTARMFRVTIVLTVLVIAGFAIGVQFGLMGVVYSYLAWNCVSLPVNLVYGGRETGLRAAPVVAAIGPPLALAVILGGALAGIEAVLPSVPLLAEVAVLVAAAAVLYGAEIAVVKPSGWTELRAAGRDLRGRNGTTDWVVTS